MPSRDVHSRRPSPRWTVKILPHWHEKPGTEPQSERTWELSDEERTDLQRMGARAHLQIYSETHKAYVVASGEYYDSAARRMQGGFENEQHREEARRLAMRFLGIAATQLAEPKVREPEPEPEVEQPQIESIEIFDLNPLFTGGMSLEAMHGPAELLRLVKERRVGVSADGVSHVLLRVVVEKPGEVVMKLKEGAGSLEMLFSGRTHAEGEKHFAFAHYLPPASFPGKVQARSHDPRLGGAGRGAVAYREVPVSIRFLPEAWDSVPVEETLRLKLVRPPVVLVHGTFDNPRACWTVAPTGADTRHGSASMVEALSAAGFFPFLVDFEGTNGSSHGEHDKSSFGHNRNVLWSNTGGIYEALREYREALDVAATQVDVVGHSLGGLIPRLWASEGYNPRGSAGAGGFRREGVHGYRRVDNFEAGDIHRLITLCTPHLGSDLGHLALVFKETPEPLYRRLFVGRLKGVALFLVRLFTGYDVTAVVRDQLPHLASMPNGALQRIGATDVPSHAIVCWARLPDLKDFGGSYAKLPEWGLWWLLHADGAVVEAFLRARGQERDMDRILGETLTAGWLLRDPQGEVGDPLTEAIHIKDQAVLHNLLRAAIFGNTQNDLVVRVESQIGGLPIKYTTQLGGILHSFAPRYERVQQAVVRLLGGPEREFHSRGFPAPPYLRNVEPFQAAQDPVARAKAIQASGYVPSHAEAISLIAMQENVVILARPVNRNSTSLIAAHNATKDMHVKGKSASWGPQKGYIPVEQRFSKLHFARKDRQKEIDKYDGEVKKCLSAGRAKKTELVVQAGGVTCAVLILEGIQDPEQAIVLKAHEGGTYHGWKNGRLGTFNPANAPVAPELSVSEIESRGTRPFLVLADRNSGRPLTADYDMLAFATRFQPQAPLSDPEMGGIRPYQVELIRKINNEVRVRANYIGGDVTHHGPEVLFDKSPGADYPITAFEPSGHIVSIREGRVRRSDYWLKRYFHHLKTRGWVIEPNQAAWRWGAYDPERWPGIGYFPDDRPKPKETPDNAFDSDQGGERPLALPPAAGGGGR